MGSASRTEAMVSYTAAVAEYRLEAEQVVVGQLA